MVSINRKCKDSVGGLDKIYLFKHQNYSRSQVILNNNILATYPSTIIYEFEVDNQPNANQKGNENEGGKYYDISINFDLSKELGKDYSYMLGFDFNIIIKDRNGKYRFLGNRNGLTCSNVKYTTGGAKNSLNGVSLSFNGMEEKEAWYINNLNDAGFVLSTQNFRITQAGEFRITQDNNFRITQ